MTSIYRFLIKHKIIRAPLPAQMRVALKIRAFQMDQLFDGTGYRSPLADMWRGR